MSDRSKYSRTYWKVMDDPQFDGIRENTRHFGAWSLMLIAADMAWPTLAYVPPMVQPASFRILCDAGLVEPLSGGRFRLQGLDSERERRKAAATRDPTGTQLGPNWDPEGRVAKPIAKQRLDEPTDEQARERNVDPADVYWRLTGKYPTDKVLTWIDQMTERYGAESVCRAVAVAHIADRSTATLLGRTQDRLRADARELDRQEREAEQASLRQKRAIPRVEEPWIEEYRQSIQKQYEDSK